MYLPPGAIPWDETTAGTGAGATASHAAESKRQHFVVHISGHVDADQAIQVLTGAAGATVAAEWLPDVSAEGFDFEFNGLWAGTPGIKVEATIANSTANCQINMSGYSLLAGTVV